MIRVVHQLTDDLGGRLDSYLRALPEDVRRHSYVDGTSQTVLLELWSDEDTFAAFWLEGYRDSYDLRALSASARSEVYPFAPFTRRRWTWMSSSRRGPARVQWGNARAVRVLYQYFLDPGDPAHDPYNTAETLREPGCEQFAYFADQSGNERHLLVELWADQDAYDVHWKLREISGETRAAPESFEETLPSEDVIEFYRYQAMRCLYGVWGISDEDQASHAIDWGSP